MAGAAFELGPEERTGIGHAKAFCRKAAAWTIRPKAKSRIFFQCILTNVHCVPGAVRGPRDVKMNLASQISVNLSCYFSIHSVIGFPHLSGLLGHISAWPVFLS